MKVHYDRKTDTLSLVLRDNVKVVEPWGLGQSCNDNDTFEWGKERNVMARPLRLQFPGAIYHLTSRGNVRQKVFFTDADR